LYTCGSLAAHDVPEIFFVYSGSPACGKPEKTAAADESGGDAPEEVTALTIIPQPIEETEQGVELEETDENGGGVEMAYLTVIDERTNKAVNYTMAMDNPIKSEREMILEQLPEGTQIIKFYQAAENGEQRMVTDENGQKRYVITYDDDGYPCLTHKP
jgi:hypothetical protein